MYDLNTIDAYILGKLPPDEKNSFEQTLASDTSLQAQLNERKELVLITQLASASARKKELKQLYTELETQGKITSTKNELPETNPAQNTQQKGKLVRLLPILAIAACLTALCYFLIIKVEPTLNNLNNTLVAEYYTPYSVTVRSNDNPTVKDKAYQLYSDQKYKEALPLLGQLGTENEEASLLEGIALLETGSTENALKRFEELKNSLLFSDHAKWYAALAHLQLNQQAKAKALLQSLTNQTEYSDKATELLGKLK